MKKQRNKTNDPEYIDIFAEDEDTDSTEVIGSIFDDEDGAPVSVTSKKPTKVSGSLFSRRKRASKASAADDDSSEEPEEERDKPGKKKHSLFTHKETEPEEDTSFDPDEEDEDEIEDEPDGSDRSKHGLSSLISWRERDEDEEPPSAHEAEIEDEPEVKEKKKRFSISSLFKDNDEEDEDDLEDDAEEGPDSEEEPQKKRFTPVYTVPAENKDEDWDIGGDFSDSFAEPESDAVEESADDFSEVPEVSEEPSAEDKAKTFSFDRYGRRKEKTARSHYGHRKYARKASTTVVTNETDTRREEEEARIRAEKRDIIRDREIKKRKEERRVRFIRELKQRLTVAGLLGILCVLILLAAYFAFRITGIDVTGVCTRYSSDQIVEMSGLKRGRHILLQNLSEARDNLNADPYLSATVKYVFPNKINIAISERRGIGVVQWGPDSEYLALIDGRGYVLETDMSSQGGLPVVKGLVVTRVMAGTKIGDDADEQVQSTLDVLDALDEFGLLYSITSIDMSETMGISMFTPEGYRIELGSVSELMTKLSRLKKGWKTIMSTAAEQMRKPSVDNVTIYLYAKSGVVVSPHGVGYVDENQAAGAAIVNATPEPGIAYQTDPNIVYATPEPTPEPADIIPPFNNEPFTG